MRLTIDTSAMAHAIRRWLWRACCFHAYPSECRDCGKRLDADELRYYGHRCERCEGISWAHYERAEREHLGDADKGTGIYAPRRIPRPGPWPDPPAAGGKGKP